MLRRLIVLTTLAAGMSLATVLTLATPALAKGPSQARITGPGLAYTIIVTVNGEFTRPGKLYGQIRQDLSPRAAGGPLIYTPAVQPGGQVPVFGWFRASRHLRHTLAK